MSLDKAIEGVLELSADAHIARRMEPKGSPTFHALTGAIAAYGKVLALIVALEAAAKNAPQLAAPVDVPQSESDPQVVFPSSLNSPRF